MSYKGCRKVRYRGRKQALGAMNAVKASHPRDPRIDALEIYHCRRCRGWHVGHNGRAAA